MEKREMKKLGISPSLLGFGCMRFPLTEDGKIDHKDPEKRDAGMKKNNMAPVAVRLAELVDTKVEFCSVTRGAELEEKVAALKDGEIVLVQNTRYEKGESKNDPELAA